MFEKKFVRFLLCLAVVLSFSATATMGADILFLTSSNPTHMPGDDALKAFIEALGHTVTYFDDNETEAAMEAAAAAVDLVFMSESVGSGQVNTKITEVEIPMVTTESYAWDEMGLTHGGGKAQNVVTTDVEFVDPAHYLAAGLSGTVTVLTDLTSDRGPARFGNGIAGDEADVIATATLVDGQTYDFVFVYEKGAALAQAPADGSDRFAADVRVCLGFDEQSYLVWNENAYALLEAAINYALATGPLTQARSPRPRDGAIDVPQDAVLLSWKPGVYADKHDVYFGTVSDDVNESSRDNDPNSVLVSQNQAETTYEPSGLLEFGQSYYWRVDEFNDIESNSPWKGNTWSFKVIDHFIVEDFEDYNDYSPDEIFGTWLDGYGIETNGALVGHDADFSKGEHIVETTIVHGGEQSMPFFYNNSGTANYSEAERAFSPAQDWTVEGVGVLSLWLKGNPAYVGSFVEGPVGTYTMTASGKDIWGNSDEFHFAWKEVSGAAAIVAKVESVENVHEWAKAGVMIRDTLEADSRHAMVAITPGNGVWFGRRETAGGSSVSTSQADITAPQWVKLERTVGGLARAHYSADGNTWTQLGVASVTMNTPMYIGLALTSHDTALTCEAKFSNVTSDGTGQWTDQDVGMLSNEAEPMYVSVEDGSGTSATVYHNDPDASLINTWAEWNIPLTDFSDQGVVLTDVGKLAIGFGSADNPQPGGSGLMYFDDIRLYLPR